MDSCLINEIKEELYCNDYHDTSLVPDDCKCPHGTEKYRGEVSIKCGTLRVLSTLENRSRTPLHLIVEYRAGIRLAKGWGCQHSEAQDSCYDESVEGERLTFTTRVRLEIIVYTKI